MRENEINIIENEWRQAGRGKGIHVPRSTVSVSGKMEVKVRSNMREEAGVMKSSGCLLRSKGLSTGC